MVLKDIDPICRVCGQRMGVYHSPSCPGEDEGVIPDIMVMIVYAALLFFFVIRPLFGWLLHLMQAWCS